MGKIRSFLSFFALSLAVVFAGNAFAAGYDCTSKKYTSCNSGYYMSDDNCLKCGANSSASSSTATACTCQTGYSVGGTPSGATTTTSEDCMPINTTITLNKNRGTQDGTTALYAIYGTNVYLDSTHNSVITTTSGAFTAPQKSYTITYNLNYDGASNPRAGTSSAEFKGFFSATSGGTQYTDTQYLTTAGLSAAKSATSNTTWYAQWGTQPALTTPTVTRTGYTLRGWGTTPDATTGLINGSFTPSKDMTLYAIWDANMYTVVFNANGAEGTMNNQALTYDTPSNLNANKFIYPGMKFMGWAQTSNGAVMYTDKQSVLNLTSTRNATLDLYAIWGDAETYTITYENVENATNNNPLTYTVQSHVTFADAQKSGYSFDGWFSDAEFNNKITKTTGTGNITVYAKWTPNEYKVNYDCGSGDYVAGFNISQDVNYEEKFTTQPAAMCSNPGHTFDGWDSTEYPEANTEYTYTTLGNIRLTAKWTKNVYACKAGEYLAAGATACTKCPARSYCEGGSYTYSTTVQGITGQCPTEYPDSAEGSDAQEDCYITKYVSEGAIPENCYSATYSACAYNAHYGTAEEPCTPTSIQSVTAKAGAYVSGTTCVVCGTGRYQTKDNSSATSCSSSCASGYTITGTTAADHNQQSDCYRVITLDKNGGSGTITTSVTCYETKPCDFGTTDKLTQTGYTFTGGWGTSPACVAITTSFTTPTTSQYYACKTANKYTVSFDANGGTGGQTASVQAVYDSAMPSISTTAPILPGYNFAGWYDAKTGGTQYYTAAGTSAHNWDIAFDATLYAQWTVGAMNTITLDANGGNAVADLECNVESADITLPETTRTGHTFDGWYNDKTSAKTEVIKSGTCTSAQSFTARWTECGSCVNGTGISTCSVSVSNNVCVATATCSEGYETPVCTDLSCACSPKDYVVTYDCGTGTGSAPTVDTATYNETFTPKANTCTAPDGEAFSHWYDETTNRVPNKGFLWTYTSDRKLTAQYVVSSAEPITYDPNGGNIINYGSAPMACNKDTATFELPTDVVRPGYSFGGWLDKNGSIVTSVATGTCTSALTFTAQWEACNSTTDGDCNCTAGTYPNNGVCTSCMAACSTLSDEYQGTYNICQTGDAEQQCYKTCEIACEEPSSCPANFRKCDYNTDEIVSGVQYYNSSECVTSDNTCSLDLTSTLTICNVRYYMKAETGTCESCSSLDGNYDRSQSGTYANGPYACFASCSPTCNHSADYVLDENGQVVGDSVNHCPEHATCTEGTIPSLGYSWYPQSVCTPTSFCSFTFVCDPGYVANTTDPIEYGYSKTLYSAPMTASDVATCTPGTYMITLNDNNGTGGSGIVYQKYTVGWYENIDATTSVTSVSLPTRTGYTFIGYYDAQTGGNKVIGTDGVLPASDKYTTDTVLYAQWQTNNYDIVYNLDGGHYEDAANPESYTIEDTPFALIEPVKRGYDFSGWFSDSNFTTQVTEIATNSVGNKEFWAKWTPTTYKITYNLDGGSYTGASNTTEYTIEDTPITLNMPYKTGFTFTKWTDASGNAVVQIAKDAIGDIVLTANWANDTYVITYELNGGANNPSNPKVYTISDTPIALSAPTKLGYIFAGWTGDAVSEDAIVAGTTGNITVVALWEPTQFTVVFDPTDATDVTIEDVVCTYDQECIAAGAIEVQNKTFSGWNTQKDGQGKGFAAGSSIKNLVTDGTEITLFAIWDQNMVSCEAGYYFDNGVRTRCELGQYCPGDGEINEGSTGCIEVCPAGGATVIAGANSIAQCRKVTIAGDIKFEFGTAKWDCAYTSGAGDSAIYRTDCNAIALTCDAGYYYTGNGAIACTPVMDGYYSPAPTSESGVEDITSKQAHACLGETGDNDGIGSSLPRAGEGDCFKQCSLTTADVSNSKTVTPDTERSAYNIENMEYPACSYTITCKAGYTPQNGTNPQCVANKYTITMDKNQGTGDATTSIECTFDSGACKLPATTGLNRAGYVNANKWCTSADGAGICYTADAVTSENISLTGTSTTLFAKWEPDVLKIELIASDATENASQDPVYLKYTVGWFADAAGTTPLTSIDTSALPRKPGYNFAGYSVDETMIVDASGLLITTVGALSVTTVDTDANIVWFKGETTCEPGYYYAGTGGECTVCAENHWCPGGTFPTDTGVIGGHNVCPEDGLSSGGTSATSQSVCYKYGLTYTSASGKATGTQTCNYDTDKNAYTSSCRDHSVKKCAAGYYYVSGIDCTEVDQNYYSNEGDLVRYACPEDGLTGNLTTAEDVGECYKTVEYIASYGTGTQVCNYTSNNDDGSARYATDCRDKYITKCQGGYYRENATSVDCIAVGFDAYSEADNLNKTPCPDGGNTSIETAATSTMCFKAENPFVSEHGNGVRHCSYTPETGDYTVCGDKIFHECDSGYYWNAYGDNDCTPVGYGYFGPVADAGNTGHKTARQACATFDGREGLTETETSGDATACFMTDMECAAGTGTGTKTCWYNTNAEDYSASCTTCAIDTCAGGYYLNNNTCTQCPEGSICDENTGKDTDGDGIPDSKPQVCANLFGGRYPYSDAGSTSTDQCWGTCDVSSNAASMSGRNYAGETIADTCAIETCGEQYYMSADKSACLLCPTDMICDDSTGKDEDGDGTPDGQPKSCTDLTKGTHPFAEQGSYKVEHCYMLCEDYDILGGTAVAVSPKAQYNNMCMYKGMSETGNPCEIQKVNGADTCIETSCNSDYELIDGRCKKCDRENATAYKPNGNCLVAKCHTGFHPEEDQCVDDIRDCTAPNAIAATQTWDNKLGAFGICKITECISGYHVASNACVPDTEVCKIEHGIGMREWDYTRNSWGDCIATSCDAGYTNDRYESDEPNKQCGRCRNANSVLGQPAVSSYARGCEIATCLYQGELYNLENNECVPICPTAKEYEDETGYMYWDDEAKKCVRDCKEGYMSW